MNDYFDELQLQVEVFSIALSVELDDVEELRSIVRNKYRFIKYVDIILEECFRQEKYRLIKLIFYKYIKTNTIVLV